MKKIAIALLLSAVAVPAVASDMYVGLRAGQAKTNIDNNTFNSLLNLSVFENVEIL